MTAATQQKRQELSAFIEAELAPYSAVQGVVGVGSIASGLARPGSDIDAVVFFDPYDAYIVPAESIWLPSSRTFHSIFSRAPGVQETGIQLDLARYDLAQWSDPDFAWPEPVCSGLRAGWMAYDRGGQIAELIQARTAYDESGRLARLDDAIVVLDLCLEGVDPQATWEHLGAATAFDRMHAAYDALVAALFAYNRRWRPYRSREMSQLLRLPWLPAQFETRVLPALNAPSLAYAGYAQRFQALQELFNDLQVRLSGDSHYGDDPIGRAFIRSHEEPGRAWNMAQWNQVHAARYGASDG